MIELELKFGVPAAVLPGLRVALRQHGARQQRLRACYFDTADAALAGQHLALRLRQEGGRWVQTLKAPGDSLVHRLEHEVVLPGRRRPALQLARHAGTPAGDALQRVLAGRTEDALIECYHTDVTRLACRVEDATGCVLELALDTGWVGAAGRRAALAELEIEHLEGPVAGLFVLARAWQRHGGLWLCSTPKSARGERLRQGLAHAPPARGRVPVLPGRPDGDALLRGCLSAALQPLLDNASEAAEGDGSDERIHQLRVSLRRLRTLLRELPGLAPGLDSAWDQALAAPFARLGTQRDDRVVADAVAPLLAAAGAPLLRWTPRPADDVATMVRATAFQQVLLDLLARVHAEAPGLSAAEARQHVAQRLDRLHRRVAAAAKDFHRRPVAAQHRVRKQAKRLRYLAELVAPLWPAAAVARTLQPLRVAQDALGHHNDVLTAALALRDQAEIDARAWFGAGFLLAHGAVTGRAARQALRAVRAQRPFWRR